MFTDHPKMSRRATRTRLPRASSMMERLESRELLSADLTGSFGGLTTQVMNGSSTRVGLVVSNSATSTRKVNAALAVQVYAVPTGTKFSPDGDNAVLLTTAHPVVHVSPGGSQQVTFNVPISTSLAAGSYQLVAVINSNQRVAETDFTNNVAVSDPLTVTQRNFDLVSSISVNQLPSVVAGAAARGTARIVVTNTAASTASVPANVQIPVQVLARPVGATDSSSDIVLGTAKLTVSNLRPGATRTITVPLTFPATMTAGDFNLLASPNGTDVLAESNNLNDQGMLTQTLTVQPTGTIVTQPLGGIVSQPVTPIISQPVTPIVSQPVTPIVSQPVNSVLFNNGFSPGSVGTPVSIVDTSGFGTGSIVAGSINTSTLTNTSFPIDTFGNTTSITGLSGLSPSNLNLFPTLANPLTLGGTTQPGLSGLTPTAGSLAVTPLPGSLALTPTPASFGLVTPTI